MLSTIIWVAVSAALAAFIVFYLWPVLKLALAKKNLFWTYVEEGTMKGVLGPGGKWLKTILSKDGHRLARRGERREDGTTADKDDVIPLTTGEIEQPDGPYWVGLWPLRRVYTRSMDYKKALPAEEDPAKMIITRHWDNVDYTLAQEYYYGIDMPDVEDKDFKPVNFKIAVVGVPENARKVNTAVRNFYDALVGLVKQPIQAVSWTKRYEDVDREKLAAEFMDAIRKPAKPTERSAFDQMREVNGMRIVRIIVMDIGLSPTYQEPITRKWVAEQDAEAEAMRTGGALNRMVDSRLKKLADRLNLDRDVGEESIPAHETKAFKAFLRTEEGRKLYERIDRESLDLLRRDRAGDGLSDTRISDGDGNPIDPIGSYLIAAIQGLRGGGDANTGSSGRKDRPIRAKRLPGQGKRKDNQGGQGGNQGNQGDQNPPAGPTKTDEESAQEYFDKHKKWPKWDPKKRTPN